MSQEDVEVVRGIYDAFNRGDAGALVEASDPEVSIEDHGVPDGKSYHGQSGVLNFLSFQAESFRGQRVEAQEVIGTGGTLLVVVRLSVEGASSGVPVATEFAHVWELHAGKVRRLRVYRSKADALEAAGVRE
jgi:ketosteroid isomerase-like protein